MDKVKLHAQERLDLDDTRALQSLIYDYVQEALGGLMGNAHGVLSTPRFAIVELTAGVPELRFKPFSFVTTTPVDNGTVVAGGTEYTQFKSVVINYDPEEETLTGIDIDYLRENFAQIVSTLGSQSIWARPVYVDTDTGTRRKWDVASGAEVTVSVQTRESQRVVFVIQNGEPSYAEGEARWARLGTITGFTDGDDAFSLPVISWNSVFDDNLINTLLETSDTVVGMSSLLALREDTPFENNKSYRTFALPLLLTELRKQIAEIKGLGTLLPWTGVLPVNSDLVSLSARLINLEARQVSPVQCIASCRVAVTRFTQLTSQNFIATMTPFHSYGVTRTFTMIDPSEPAQKNRLHIKLNNEVLEQEWAITHVSVTQDIAYLESVDGHRDYNRVTFLVHPDAYTQDTSNTSTMRLYDNTAENRGVIIEFLPQEVLAESHGHSEDEIHVPMGNEEGDSTTIINSLNNSSTVPPYDLVFTVAVFAVPSADVNN